MFWLLLIFIFTALIAILVILGKLNSLGGGLSILGLVLTCVVWAGEAYGGSEINKGDPVVEVKEYELKTNIIEQDVQFYYIDVYDNIIFIDKEDVTPVIHQDSKVLIQTYQTQEKSFFFLKDKFLTERKYYIKIK